MDRRIVVTCAALLLGACARPAAPPNVLLIVVDTLRADRVGVFGAERPLTPRVDALAREGLWYTRAQSPRSKTTPAVATILTGLYPHAHGVRDLTTPLEESVPTLAEHLRAAGWDTGAIVGNFVLKQELAGLRRGFSLWVEDLPDQAGVPPHDVPQRRARSLTDGALCALGLGPPSADGAGPAAPLARPGRPWFLWLHYMDPHGAYDPPPEHRIFRRERPDPIPREEERPAGALHERWIADYNVLAEDHLSDGRIDAALVRDRYDGEVHYVDAELGRLFDALRAAGLFENTLVVLVADHGESLGEHDYWFEHGRTTYQVTCGVPLVIRLPDGFEQRPPPGPRGANVALADLAPTLCELLRLDPLPGLAGRGPRSAGSSLRSTFARGAEGPRAVFSEKVERAEVSGAIQAKAVRRGDWKLIRRYTHAPDPARPGAQQLLLLDEELYELAADPYEQQNLADAPPPTAPRETLRELLLEYTAEDADFEDLARRLQDRREELGRMDPDTLRVLESLGY